MFSSWGLFSINSRVILGSIKDRSSHHRPVIGTFLCKKFQGLSCFLCCFHHRHVTCTADFDEVSLWKSCLDFASAINGNEGIRVTMDQHNWKVKSAALTLS